MKLTFRPMTHADAREFTSWQYEGDYAMYNLSSDDIEAEAKYMVNPDNHFYAIYDGEDMVGHAVFHGEARVAGGDYSIEALDIGAGMRPDWTGQGKGGNIIAQIMKFGREHYEATAFRATIAAWNKRAQKATTKNGFTEVSRFISERSGKEFIIFLCEL